MLKKLEKQAAKPSQNVPNQFAPQSQSPSQQQFPTSPSGCKVYPNLNHLHEFNYMY